MAQRTAGGTGEILFHSDTLVKTINGVTYSSPKNIFPFHSWVGKLVQILEMQSVGIILILVIKFRQFFHIMWVYNEFFFLLPGRSHDSYNLIESQDIKQAIFSTVSISRYRLNCSCQLLRKENMEICSRMLPYEMQSYPVFKGPIGNAAYLKREKVG